MLKQVFSLLLAVVSFAAVASVSLAVPAGPGGIGSGSGASELRLWLKADYGVQTGNNVDGFSSALDNQKVSQWVDASGYGVNATQTAVANQPSFQTGEVNSLPTIRFEGSVSPNPDVLHYLLMPHFIDFAEPTIYIVGKRDDGSGVGSAFAVGGHSTNPRIQFRYHNSGDRYWITAGDQDGTLLGNVIADTTDNIQHIGMMNIDGQTMTVTHNGVQRYSETRTNVDPALNYDPTPFNLNAQPRLGWNAGADAYRLDGDLSEVIVFDRPLTSIERTMVDNALAAKWNIANFSAGVDRYHGDDNAKGDYDFGVFGIGRDATSTLLTNASSGLEISATSLDTGNYALAGYKTQQNSLVIVGEDVLWTRDFYIDVTGSFDATLTFDFAAAGMSFNDAFDRLLFSTTEGGPYVVLSADATFSGNQVSFGLTADQFLTGYYTLAGAIPEPSSFGLLGLGLVCLARRRRRQPERVSV